MLLSFRWLQVQLNLNDWMGRSTKLNRDSDYLFQLMGLMPILLLLLLENLHGILLLFSSESFSLWHSDKCKYKLQNNRWSSKVWNTTKKPFEIHIGHIWLSYSIKWWEMDHACFFRRLICRENPLLLSVSSTFYRLSLHHNATSLGICSSFKKLKQEASDLISLLNLLNSFNYCS